MACCDYWYISLCWNFWKIEKQLFLKALPEQSFAWQKLAYASVFPVTNTTACSLLVTKDGMVSASNFDLVSRLVFFGNQTCSTSTFDDAFDSILQKGLIPGFWKRSRTTRIIPRFPY